MKGRNLIWKSRRGFRFKNQKNQNRLTTYKQVRLQQGEFRQSQ